MSVLLSTDLRIGSSTLTVDKLQQSMSTLNIVFYVYVYMFFLKQDL
jgi:hypothetical protein